MLALVWDDSTKSLSLDANYPMPEPAPGEALIRVHRAGICATVGKPCTHAGKQRHIVLTLQTHMQDIEITRGYVPGYCQPLGHEFVGIVVSCASEPGLVGQRVVGEINVNTAGFSCADAVFQRNHVSDRCVLGIINKPGCFASFVTLPATNLHRVPLQLSDGEAAFCEPLAAACRVLEQGLLQQQPGSTQRVAVVGDGRLGLLIAQVLALRAPGRVTHFGRHADKMQLVCGTVAQLMASPDVIAEHAAAFDLVVEASGSASSIRAALKLTKPMGTLVLKTTVSVDAEDMPGWSELANDIVVNEKVLVGSRCGPMDVALSLMAEQPELRKLLRSMVQHEVPLQEGVAAMSLAAKKGVLKVQLVMEAQQG